MSNPSPDPHTPTHHSHKPNSAIAAGIGAIGGAALFIGILVWYVVFVVNKPAPPMPNTPLNPAAGGSSASAPVLDTPILEIEPLAEMHVKIVDGMAVSVDAPPEAGVSAKLDGRDITVTSAKDAKEGTYKIKVRGPKGQETNLTVNVKKKK